MLHILQPVGNCISAVAPEHLWAPRIIRHGSLIGCSTLA